MPRMGLTPDSVVSAAVVLADEHGVDELTLAALAAQVGVRVPSLYKHVDGLEDLRRRVAVVGTAALDAAVTRAAEGRQGRDALVSIAQAYRRFARVHPGQYEALMRFADPLAEPGPQLPQLLARVATDYKLDGEDGAHAVRTVQAALHGFVSLQARGGYGRTANVEASFYAMLALLDRGLGGWTQPGKSSGGLLGALLRR